MKPPKPMNRCRRARENAGLSSGQAARKLGVAVDLIKLVEENDAAYVDAGPARFADLYGVNLDWLSGRGDLCDYAALKRIDGADELYFADREQIAELLASLSRHPAGRSA